MTASERVAWFIGQVARPNVLFVSSWSSGIVTVAIPFTGADLIAGAAFIGTAWAGTAALYGAKSLEEGRKAKVEGQVAIAQAQAGADK